VEELDSSNNVRCIKGGVGNIIGSTTRGEEAR